MAATLDTILAATRERLANAKRMGDPAEMARHAQRHTPRGFRAALERAAAGGLAVIAELKQASPSRGMIRANFPVGRLAAQLEQGGAAALSVLTEPKFFQGSLANLHEASSATRLPCLRKDFLIDPFQLLEAKANRADAVLLIVAALTDAELSLLLHYARELGLDALCEVHDEAELQRALQAGADLVGVNSRDLRTLHVDLITALRLGPKIPDSVVRVAESGIAGADDICRLREAGYRAFLVGESLMRAERPGDELARWLEEAADRVSR